MSCISECKARVNIVFNSNSVVVFALAKTAKIMCSFADDSKVFIARKVPVVKIFPCYQISKNKEKALTTYIAYTSNSLYSTCN